MPEDKDLLLKQQEEINHLKKELKKASKPSSMLSVLKNSLKQSVHDFFVREDKMKHMAEQIKTLEKKLEESNEENDKKAAELIAVTAFQSDDDSSPNDSDIPNFPQTKEAAVREYFSGIDLQTLAMQLHQNTAIKTDMPNAADTFMPGEYEGTSESDNSQKDQKEQNTEAQKKSDQAETSSTEKINNAKPLFPLQPNLAKNQHKHVKNDGQRQADLQVKEKNQGNPESNEHCMQSIDKKTQLENTAGKNDKNAGKHKNDVQHNCQPPIDDDSVITTRPEAGELSTKSGNESSFAGEAATKSGDTSPLPSRHQALALTSESDRMSAENKYNESSFAGELSTKSSNDSGRAGKLPKAGRALPPNDYYDSDYDNFDDEPVMSSNKAQQRQPIPEKQKGNIVKNKKTNGSTNLRSSSLGVSESGNESSFAGELSTKFGNESGSAGELSTKSSNDSGRAGELPKAGRGLPSNDDAQQDSLNPEQLKNQIPSTAGSDVQANNHTSAATATVIDKNGRKKSKTDKRNKNKKKQIKENQNTNTKDSIESSVTAAKESEPFSEGSELSQMKRSESDNKKQRSELPPNAEETDNLNYRAEYNVTDVNLQTDDNGKFGRGLPSINNTTNKNDNGDTANSDNGILSPTADLPEDFGIIIEPDYPSVNDMPDPSSDDSSSIFDDFDESGDWDDSNIM